MHTKLRRLRSDPEAGALSEFEATAVSDFVFKSAGRNLSWLFHALRTDNQRRALAEVARLASLGAADVGTKLYNAGDASDRM